MSVKSVLIRLSGWLEVFAAFLVILAGLIVALGVPCFGLVWLAGGEKEATPLSFLFFFFWPAALLISLLTMVIDRWRKPKIRTYQWGEVTLSRPGLVTTIWLLYYFSPIVLNLTAKLLHRFGQHEPADRIFRFRWVVHPGGMVLAMTAVVLFFLIGGAIDAWSRRGKTSLP